MNNYSKPILSSDNIMQFESVNACSGNFYQNCCGCHANDAASYASFYQVHCLNCSNRQNDGTCRYGKNTGAPK